MSNSVPLPKSIKTVHAQPYGYRIRMDFVLSPEGPGLRKKESFRDIVPIKQCPISNKKLNGLLTEVWQFFNGKHQELDIFLPKEKTGTLKYAVIRTPEYSNDSSITFILNKESANCAVIEQLLEEFSANTTARNVLLGKVGKQQDLSISADIHPIKGSVFLEEVLYGKKIRFHSQAFFQNNSIIAEKMLRYCRDIFKKYRTSAKTLVDLYGGAGTFGLALSDLFSKVLIIDNAGDNIKGARANIGLNGLNNIEARCADARIIGEDNASDLMLVIDPPRAGLHPKLVKKILDLKAEVMVYVSCNPAQMAKELALFQEQYEIKSLGVFDHFPQTPHIEAIAELVLR